jgi:hypothetical protein
MSHEGYDRRAFTDASNVVEIVREARTRAVARGAAELLIMHAPGSGNTASFTLWEATSTITTGDAGFVSASSSCNPPTVWPNFTGYGSPGAATAAFVDEFQIGGANSLESQSQGNINMQVYDPTPTAVTTNLYLCFTPAGRSYYATGASPPAAGFVNALGSSGGVGAITVTVAAGTLSGVNGSNSTNLVRTVWIPPSGAASLTSQ